MVFSEHMCKSVMMVLLIWRYVHAPTDSFFVVVTDTRQSIHGEGDGDIGNHGSQEDPHGHRARGRKYSLACIWKYVPVHGSYLSWIWGQFPITAIREIKILKKLHHQNIVNLEKVVTLPGLTNITRIRALFWQTPLGRGLRLVLIVLRTERDEGKQSMILNKNTIESFALLLI